VVAVADVFDALTHDRPYKSAWPVEHALAEIRSGAGSQFDPRVVAAFLEIHEELAPASEVRDPRRTVNPSRREVSVRGRAGAHA